LTAQRPEQVKGAQFRGPGTKKGKTMQMINDPAAIGVTDAGTEMRKAEQRATLVDVLAEHQWGPDTRFCRCGAAIRHNVPASRAMAEHQATEIKAQLPDLVI
jgi:hypothetical protein